MLAIMEGMYYINKTVKYMKAKHFLTCLSLLAAALAAGCSSFGGQMQTTQSTISVQGTGTVSVRPDMIQMTISMIKVEQTTRRAQEEVNRMVRQALAILKDSGVEDKNISTASLSFSSEYDYYSGRRELLGQKAEQRITFSIEDIQNDEDKVSRIIDQLIGINGIELNQISFNVKNNTEYFVRSRELAYQKAVEKANQYAALSGLKVVKVLSVSEDGYQQPMPIYNRMANQAVFAEASMDAGSTTVPTGELEVTTRILVVFLLE